MKNLGKKLLTFLLAGSMLTGLMTPTLAAEGESRVGAIHHIRRGYEDIVRDLRMLGAEIAVY